MAWQYVDPKKTETGVGGTSDCQVKICYLCRVSFEILQETSCISQAIYTLTFASMAENLIRLILEKKDILSECERVCERETRLAESLVAKSLSRSFHGMNDRNI